MPFLQLYPSYLAPPHSAEGEGPNRSFSFRSVQGSGIPSGVKTRSLGNCAVSPGGYLFSRYFLLSLIIGMILQPVLSAVGETSSDSKEKWLDLRRALGEDRALIQRTSHSDAERDEELRRWRQVNSDLLEELGALEGNFARPESLARAPGVVPPFGADAPGLWETLAKRRSQRLDRILETSSVEPVEQLAMQLRHELAIERRGLKKEYADASPENRRAAIQEWRELNAHWPGQLNELRSRDRE